MPGGRARATAPVRDPARVAVVLAFAVAAVLAGADSVTAISEWAADVPAEVLAALGAWTDRRGRRVPPSRSTFRRVLRKLDGEAAAAAFGIWLTAQVMAGLADAAAVIVRWTARPSAVPGPGTARRRTCWRR